MNYKSFNLGDWIGHISGVIEDETTLDGNEMRDLVEFLSTLEQEPCEDTIGRQVAIDELDKGVWGVEWDKTLAKTMIESLPPAQPEIIRCKDCKFYSPMNRETKTGICNLIMHQNFGDNWFCAGAERRPDESDRKRSGD